MAEEAGGPAPLPPARPRLGVPPAAQALPPQPPHAHGQGAPPRLQGEAGALLCCVLVYFGSWVVAWSGQGRGQGCVWEGREEEEEESIVNPSIPPSTRALVSSLPAS